MTKLSPIFRLVASLLVLGACDTLSARAEVIEISPGGATTVYDAPAIFGSDGARPIHVDFASAAPQTGSPVRSISDMLASAAQRYAVDQNLLTAIAWRESSYDNAAVSPKGAIGIMQLMAGTARDLGVDPHDIFQNIMGGAAYLRAMLDRYNGNTTLALAAYNAGPGAVDRSRGVPPFAETQNYVRAVLGKVAPSSTPSIILDR